MVAPSLAASDVTDHPVGQPDGASPKAPAFPARRVYSVFGVPPEVQAYAMAKYSRSSQGMLESIHELSQQKAEQFLDTFYFQYGHRSIADLAHLVFGVEQVSLLAAIALVDEQVWDGQERSTRYQPFKKTGWYTPESLLGTPAEATFREAAERLFADYELLTQRLHDLLVQSVPRPAEMAEGVFKRTLRARAFDVARSLLPMAANTSLGQVVSARVLERQVSRLLTSQYAEVRALGADLRSACNVPAEAPLLDRVLAGADGEMRDTLQPRVAPTLVKYAGRSEYLDASARALAEAARAYLSTLGEPDRSHLAELAEPSTPLDEIVATLLYRHDAAGHSYRQVQQAVAALSDRQKREVFDLSLAHRGRHDDLLREHQAGYALVFDVLMDIGSFRDLHRHRRCVQVVQPYTFAHGFDGPEDVFPAGLGGDVAGAALDQGLGALYAESLTTAQTTADLVRETSAEAADYLLPLAYRVRCLFKMDWAQAAYLTELRSGPAGHFSYRRAAFAMHHALAARYPELAAPVRISNPFEEVDLLRR